MIKRVWKKPAFEVWGFCEGLTEAPHLLIAGATGAGKNVLLDDIIWTLLGSKTPGEAQLVLIDPKRVELTKYAKTPFCVKYASEPGDIIQAVDSVIAEMERRYKEMQRKGVNQYKGAHLYLIVDELADLMISMKKDILPRLQKLAQLGRSARVHIWACSQSPSRLTIPAALTLNFTHKIALRCDSHIESRQVVGVDGAEKLPRHGQAIIKSPGEIYKQAIPMTEEEDITARIEYWRKAHTRWAWI